MKSLIALALFVASSEALMRCMPDACDKLHCLAASPCNGKFVKGGGYCGCCDSCVSLLGEGASCISMLLLGAPSTAECQPGLYCDRKTYKCARATAAAAPAVPPCHAEMMTYLQGQQNKMSLLGSRKPVCDANGYYAPKQCSGSQCYCVKRDGTHIDGYTANIWEATGQTCQCARDLSDYMATGLIGKMFYCTNDGSYQKYKCVGSVCFCADTNGNQVGASSAPIGMVDTLKC